MKLEKFGENDKELYCRLVFNEEAMNMNLGRPFTKEEAEAFFPLVLAQNAEDESLGFYKVFLRENGREEFAGMGSLIRNDEFDALEIEYMLLPQFWRRGYGTELAEKLLALAAGSGLSSRIVAITDPINKYSRRILQKEGFSFIKEYLNADGEPAVLYQKNI